MFVWTPDELNAEQESAILDDESVFLVACPGSGKTRALTYKIAYEISRLQSDKQFVVAITYTNRAADEIHERVEHLGVDTSQLWIGTIHSFCLEWILKPYSVYHRKLSKGFRVINSHDSENMITELCKSCTLRKITYWDCGFYLIEGGCKLSCPDQSKHAAIKETLAQYFKMLSDNKQLDFELILYYANQLIAQRPSISILLSKLFPFILVDEYQDTKKIQYSIVASILRAGGGETKIFIVGDPNQAIYQSLGGFAISAEDFQEMAGIKLHQRKLKLNYRSPKRIIDYFGTFNVYDTTIEPASKNKEYASLVSYNTIVSKSLLDTELIRLIRYSIETVGIAPEEVCVLAPQWVHLSSMTRKLVTSMPEYEFDGPGMEGGLAALRDHSSRPHRSPRSIAPEQIARVEQLRRERWTGVRIAQATSLSRATVSRILTRLRLNKIKMLEPKIPIVRYEHPAPGDLLHIDIKKLARIVKPGHGITGNPRDETRGAGWEFLYVAIDDHSRIAFTAMMPDEKAVTASLFLSQAAEYFARFNIRLRRVMTDNGPCFISDRFKAQCHALNARHIRTRIYTPRTNGKAERFIQTAIREWAYARLYQNSQERNTHLAPWTHQYNWHRPHASLNQMPPISRAGTQLQCQQPLETRQPKGPMRRIFVR